MKKSILIFCLITSLFSCKKEETPNHSNNGNNNNNNNTTIPERFQAFGGIFNGNGVGAVVNLSEDILLIFNKDGNKYAWFEDEEIKAVYDLSDESGHFSDYPMSTVGAVTYLHGTTLYLFDTLGMQYCVSSFYEADVDEGWNNNNIFTFSNNINPLNIWGEDNSCPFDGIGAMWNYSKPTGCFEAEEDSDYTWMVNKAGDEITKYYFLDGGEFGATIELENWLAVNTCLGEDGLVPFQSISAACRYVSPNKIEEIFFSEDGTQFCFYTVSDGVFSDIYNLYK